MHYFRCISEDMSFICNLSIHTEKQIYGPFAPYGIFSSIWPAASFESSGQIFVNSMNQGWWFFDQYRINRSLLDFFGKFTKTKTHENQMTYFDGFWSKFYPIFPHVYKTTLSLHKN